MNTPLLELEGTWEEVAAHAPELAGQRVRLTVLNTSLPPGETKSFRPASGRPLLRNAGIWAGDDLQECLEAVVNSRGSAGYRSE